MWYYISLIPELLRQRQENCQKFKAGLSCTASTTARLGGLVSQNNNRQITKSNISSTVRIKQNSFGGNQSEAALSLAHLSIRLQMVRLRIDGGLLLLQQMPLAPPLTRGS